MRAKQTPAKLNHWTCTVLSNLLQFFCPRDRQINTKLSNYKCLLTITARNHNQLARSDLVSVQSRQIAEYTSPARPLQLDSTTFERGDRARDWFVEVMWPIDLLFAGRCVSSHDQSALLHRWRSFLSARASWPWDTWWWTQALYQVCNTERWSVTIKRKRLTWFGHLQRLPENAQAKLAFAEARRPYKKIKGGQPTTWLSTVSKDLKNINITIKEASKIAQDQKPMHNWYAAQWLQVTRPEVHRYHRKNRPSWKCIDDEECKRV